MNTRKTLTSLTSSAQGAQRPPASMKVASAVSGSPGRLVRAAPDGTRQGQTDLGGSERSKQHDSICNNLAGRIHLHVGDAVEGCEGNPDAAEDECQNS